MNKIVKYRIADFPVKMNCVSRFMRELAITYEETVDDNEKFIDLCYQEEDLKEQMDMGIGMFEYNYTLVQWVQRLVDEEAFCFHSSALSVDGEGIMFSANSGTGKSTHARLWKEFIKDHQIIQLNDDKPVIRFKDGRPWVYGTPWSGKHCIHQNGKAPAKALVFLEQAPENSIQRIPPEKAFELVFPQVIGGKRDAKQVYDLMTLLDRFIRSIPVYKLKCNISKEAAELSYHTIWKGIENNED